MRGISTVCDTFNKICNISKDNISVPDKLIFHIHGGGFISMSSFIHQVYTRTWAN
jgi:hormone-sensitive lipase